MTALGYAIIGMALGIYMAAAKDHAQFDTHSHIMLLGFVVTFIYGLCHKLWLNNTASKLAVAQFYIHQAGTLVLLSGLLLLYGQIAEEAVIGPALGIGSIAVLIAMVLMLVLFVKSRNA